MKYDDETLMAYSDGELDADLRAEIAAAIAADTTLARRVDAHRALRGRVEGSFGRVLEQPVPERLIASARAESQGTSPPSAGLGGKVLQFPARGTRAPGAPWRAREWIAMAASVLLGVLLSWRLFAPSEEGVMVARNGALVARGDLATALDTQLASTQTREAAVLIGLTFKSRDGGYCRSFALRATRTAGLACRVGRDWQISATSAATLPTGEVQQAADATPPAILAAIEARIDGDALDASGEQSAQAADWNAKLP